MNNPQTQPVVLYVDGACRGNPGLGGWGAYLQLPDGQERELWGGEPDTTNNRMELTAAIEGIKACASSQPLVIWTDSNYVKQGITEWITGWKKKNWRKADGKPVINADLWQQLDQVCQNRTIAWHWIKGHAGHAGNERADMLANRGADQVKKGTGGHRLSQDPPSQDPLSQNLPLQNQPSQNQPSQNQPSQNQVSLPSTTPETNPAEPEPDWLSHDPLGLDLVFEQAPDGLYTADDEEWIDTVDARTALQQHTKEQQLEQANPQNGVQRTPATLKLSGKRQLILDTETTGFSFADGDRVIEVGVLEMINRKLTGSSFHVYLNPQRPVGDSVTVHGITDEFLQDKLLFEHIAHELDAYLAGAEIIAHNATFDMNFLEGEFLKAGLPSLKSRVEVTDTLALAKRKHPGQKNSLDALTRRYEIKQRDRTFHGALLDAEILADVYLAMTGGQVTLDIGDDRNSAASLSQHRQFAQRFNLPVITASRHEAQNHQQWLDQFSEKNGLHALWHSVFE